MAGKGIPPVRPLALPDPPGPATHGWFTVWEALACPFGTEAAALSEAKERAAVYARGDGAPLLRRPLLERVAGQAE